MTTTPTTAITHRAAAARARRRAARARREQDRALQQELAAFTSRADLLELAAILERYDDDRAAPIRRLVDWSHAA